MEWLTIPSWLDVLDIAVVTVFGWLAIRYFRRTRARAALTGLSLLAVVYVVARALDLRLTAALFQSFFAVVVIVLVVVFQEDLRRVFEQLGSGWRENRQAPVETNVLDLLCRSVARMAAARTGALIVLPGKEPIERHLDGGVVLGGRMSEPLLLSIFDASSPGHDGAVLLRGPIIERFAIHLPLSANREMLGPGGTRHAAGLGLAERCDAICIIVSEERGTVSVARDGVLHRLPHPEDLVGELQAVYRNEAEKARRPWWDARFALDAALAAAVALALWMVLVPGSDIGEADIIAAVEITNLPDDMKLVSVEPESIELTVEGLRRNLLLAQPAEVSVRVDAYLARLGRRTFTISEDDVRKPDGVVVTNIIPTKVKISLESKSDPDQEATR